MINLKEYQKLIADNAIYPNVGSNFVYPVLGLAEEAGEVVGKIKKVLRDNDGIISEEKKQEIKKELGDVLWYVAAECNELGLDLTDVISDNILKMFGRRERGTLHGSGDNR